MVARGAQGNPFIFRQINEIFETGSVITNPSDEERLDVMTEHLHMLMEYKGDYIGVREARKHIAWYIKGMKDCARMRERVCRIDDKEILFEEIKKYKEFIKGV